MQGAGCGDRKRSPLFRVQYSHPGMAEDDMSDLREFCPARARVWQSVYLFLFLLILAGVLVSGWMAWSQLQAGQGFPWWAGPVGLALLPLPWLAYGAWLLGRLRYRATPLGLEVQWDREVQRIPWGRVTWAGLLKDYPHQVRVPRGWWPGLVYGAGQTDDGRAVLAFGTASSRPVFIEAEGICWLLTPASVTEFLQAVREGLSEGDETAEQEVAPADVSAEAEEAVSVDASVAVAEKAFPSLPDASLEETLPDVEKAAPDSRAVGEATTEDAPVPHLWWQRLLRDPWASGLLAGNALLMGGIVFLWWRGFSAGAEGAMSVAYVLMVHGWLVGLAIALGFYVYALSRRAEVAYVLWLGELVLNFIFALWLGFRGV